LLGGDYAREEFELKGAPEAIRQNGRSDERPLAHRLRIPHALRSAKQALVDDVGRVTEIA
jgi:hypothetical protein